MDNSSLLEANIKDVYRSQTSEKFDRSRSQTSEKFYHSQISERVLIFYELVLGFLLGLCYGFAGLILVHVIHFMIIHGLSVIVKSITISELKKLRTSDLTMSRSLWIGFIIGFFLNFVFGIMIIAINLLIVLQ